MDFLDESDDESEAYKLFGGKEGIVFLIDSTKYMFECNQFSLAIQCVQNVMKNKAISSPSDEIAVILFGTDKTSNDDSFQNIFIVQKLQKTNVESIHDIRNLDECNFENEFGHSSQYSLADVFSTAISQFTKSKSRFETKRVILFTCVDEPHSGTTNEAKHLRRIAINRAKDFKDHNIEVELIPLAKFGNKLFDREAFYQDVFPDLKDDNCDTLTKLEPLMARVHSKSYRQRMLASLPFRFGSCGQQSNEFTDIKMSVYVYSLYLEAKKPTAVKIHRKDNKEVKPSTQRWTQDCGAVVETQDLSKKFSFGKQNIYLTNKDMKSVKNIEEPGITLLGFKPRTAIKTEYHLKSGQFIYPDENYIKGSTTLFSALLKRCAERDKIPICRLTLRRSAVPRLVALFPQIESKVLEKPGGFHVVHLPFKEDIRDIVLKDAEELPAEVEALDLAKTIVEKLNFNYNSICFKNPVLQTHWRTIEAMALNDDSIEQFDDSQTKPDYELIESKAGNDLKRLNELLGADLVNPIEKKVRLYEDLSEAAKRSQLGSLTVAELKEFCKHKNIKCGSKKAEVIDAIRHYYGII